MYGVNAVVSSTEREGKELMEMIVTVSVEDGEMSLSQGDNLLGKVEMGQGWLEAVVTRKHRGNDAEKKVSF